MPIAHRVDISQMTDEEIERLKNLLQAVASEAIKAPSWHVVHVQKTSSSYWRRAPGAKKLLEKLGPESFGLFGALLSLGIEAHTNGGRSDLSGSQKIGRASLDLLLSVTPLGLVAAGASILWPKKTEEFKTALVSKNRATEAMADQIVKFGGKRFQEWSSKPSWIDFM